MTLANPELAAEKLLAVLAPYTPDCFTDQLAHACLSFAETHIISETENSAKVSSAYALIERISAAENNSDSNSDSNAEQNKQTIEAVHLAKFWLCSEYAFDSSYRDSGLLLELIDSQDLSRSYANELRVSEYRQRLDQSIKTLLEVYVIDSAFIDEQLLPLLRRFRRREMLRIIWRDLNQLAELEETTLDLSMLASACIDTAINILHPHFVHKYGEPIGETSQIPQRLVVIGMGKLGAYELNLSSDIDLIFAFPEAGQTNSSQHSISNQEFFSQLGKALIRVIDSRTVDGFVFRVDMRLRPNGQSGPLVLNFTAMEDYYQQHGREWERYAMVKARAVAGDIVAGQLLLKSLRPFVYRRYLDFGAIDALREMKKLIEQQVKRQNLAQDIKLGSGGIREIEFIVQSFQLIHGGRQLEFQQANLLKMLTVLQDGGFFSTAQLKQLADAYRFLRDTEHALQAWRDEQTQNLSEDINVRQRMAFALGFAKGKDLDADGFSEQLEIHRENVRFLFAKIITDNEQDTLLDEHESEALQFWRWLWLSADLQACAQTDSVSKSQNAAGEFEQALAAVDSELLLLLSQFRSGRRLSAMEKQGRDRLDKLMPLLLSLCGESDAPLLALQRVMPFVESVLRRTAYIALLIENPQALKQLVNLCQTSPWIAEQLATYPSLLDELLGHRDLYLVPSGDELADELRQQLLRVNSGDLEVAMDVLRHFKLAHGLRVAACQISGALPLMKISDYLSFLAEVILQAVLEFAWTELELKYGAPAASMNPAEGALDNSSKFIIVGYGKLGGIELGPSSDLDLVFIHDVDAQAETVAGPDQKAISNTVFFTRLGQRIIHILTTQTVSGALYEVDMRLRPSGASGMLVSGIEAFARYQSDNAWTWEHQALVRARPVAGDPKLCAQFNQLREAVICQPRPVDKLRLDVFEMREKMREHLLEPAKVSSTVAANTQDTVAAESEFNLKQSSGGIVDIEFLVQFCVLANAAEYPQLARWTDNVRLLELLAEVDILSQQEAEQLTMAYKDYRAAAHLSALKQQKAFISSAKLQSHRQHVEQLWNRLFNMA